jgi:drug/metabolite transporter (DMT)-like permease
VAARTLRGVNRPRATPLVLAVGIAAVSTAATMIRFAGDPPNFVPALAIAAWRVGLAAVLLVPVTIATRGFGRSGLRTWGRTEWSLAVLSGVFLAVHFATWITSLSLTSVASSVTLVTTTPIWVAIGAAILLKERPTRVAVAGVLLATGGAIVLALLDAGSPGPRGGEPGAALLGDVLALVGALGASAYFLIGRRLRATVPVGLYAQVVYGVAGLCLVAVALSSGASLGGYPATAYVWLVLLALGPQLVGHTSLNWGLRYVSPSAVAALTLAEPIGSMTLAFLLLREPITLPKAIGAAVILAGIYLVARDERRTDGRAVVPVG